MSSGARCCAACEPARADVTAATSAALQRVPNRSARPDPAGHRAPPIVHDALAGTGTPLAGAARRTAERHLGVDLSDVRLHTDGVAAASAAAVDAAAYAVGRDIVFGRAGFEPSTPAGRRLLHHELAHVAQQAGAGPHDRGSLRIGPTDDHHERAAWRLAAPVRPSARSPVGRDRSGLLRRVGVGEWLSRFFGGGTFGDDELIAYLEQLDVTDRIEDRFDSDNKARAIVARWKLGDPRFELTPRRKTLLVDEMLTGATLDDDEDAILDLLRGSSDVEVTAIVDGVGEARLRQAIDFSQHDQLVALLRAHGERAAQAATPRPDAATGGEPFIQRVLVDQSTPQTVTAEWSDGRRRSDLCSSGKGQCCVEPDDPRPGWSEQESRVNDSNRTPVDRRPVSKPPELDHRGILYWTEFHTPRAVALHEYRPVDGTPLSHGCVRLNADMARHIYEGARVGRTMVEVVGTPRPRCDHPLLQREWAGDFRTAGTTPPDGETVSARRERSSIATERRALRGSLGVDDRGLDARIERLRTETGGLPTGLGADRESTLRSVAPLHSAIPRCHAADG